MIPLSWFIEAANRIAPYIKKTPLSFDPQYNLYLKWENHQNTGSFKLRGALNKILSLQDWERERGLVTASAGNHGQGVAMAANLVNAKVTVFASDHAVPSKLEAMQKMGVKIELVPGGYGEAEQAAIDYANTHQCTWFSPYNDGQIIAGQGTIALEILKELPEQHQLTWIAPVGGGGLISGIGAVIKGDAATDQHNIVHSRTKLIGIQPEASAFMHAIFITGDQSKTEDLPTLADGLSGPVENHSITIPLVQKYVDDMITVTETEIAQAIKFAWTRYNEIIEGSAAVTLAAIISKKIIDRPAVLILSGGNVQPDTFSQITGNIG